MPEDRARIAHESLSSAARHPSARTGLVQINVRGRRVALAVGDDGRGIAPGAGNGVGLKIMRDRANRVGRGLPIGPRPCLMPSTPRPPPVDLLPSTPLT